MLSYQHAYHAGNIADVIKHLCLTHLLAYMTQKEKPLLYLETHAGRGIYDLKSKAALKTNESRDGIELLWSMHTTLPQVFSPYLAPLHRLNPQNNLRYYPGSPWIAIDALRPHDRLFLYERHPTEFEHLHHLSTQGKRVFFNFQDGLTALNALLPPKERRGLIFIDPTYELKTEYQHIPHALKNAYQRFNTGVYAVWYPLVTPFYHEKLLRGLDAVSAKHALRVEFYFNKPLSTRIKGCGLWIINPPFVLKNALKKALGSLCQQCYQDASYLVKDYIHP